MIGHLPLLHEQFTPRLTLQALYTQKNFNMQTPSFALLTQHGKQELLRPCFEEMAWQFTHTRGFDTDSLGTFSGEVERSGPPLTCAQQKAQIASELAGSDYGLGSEGSFTRAPFGLGIVNQEIIACTHRSGRLLAIGSYEAPFPEHSITIDSPDAPQLVDFIKDLPEGQGCMILHNKSALAKGLRNGQEISDTLHQQDQHTLAQGVEISYDLRAHFCPQRRTHIEMAADNLLQKLKRRCPKCRELGFWPDRLEPGLPCEWCGQPTDRIKSRVATCTRCGYQACYRSEETRASPQYCQSCNP